MEAVMDLYTIEQIKEHFQALVAFVPLSAIRTPEQYDKAVEKLNQLLDAGGADAESPLADLANSLGSLIGDYEDSHTPRPAVSLIATLRFLMDQHRLTQSDLPEIGTQGVVSEVLSGKRELNVRQIKALMGKFHLPASVFI